MNKKGYGQMPDVMNYLWKIFLIIIVFIFVLIVANSALNMSFDTFETEANILSYRLLYSKDGISYYDPEVERVYPGIIDLEKFVDTKQIEEKLIETIDYTADPDHLVARMEIFDNELWNLEPVYLNRKYFLRWYPIAMAEGKGKGAASIIEKTYYVLLKDNRTRRLWLLENFKEDTELRRSWDTLIKPQYDNLKENYNYADVQYIPAKLVITIVRPNS
jgi:hypothetical protein